MNFSLILHVLKFTLILPVNFIKKFRYQYSMNFTYYEKDMFYLNRGKSVNALNKKI